MASNNTLVIEIQDRGSPGGGPVQGPSGGRGPVQGPASSTSNTGGNATPFNPVIEAIRQVDQADRRKAVQAEVNRMTLGSFGATAKTIGQFASTASAAGVPGAGAVGNIASSAVAGAQIAGPIGAVAGAIVSAGKEFFSFVHNSATEFAATARQYNPAVATQAALNDVNRVMGDIRRAEQLGPELTDFTRAQGRFNEAKEDLLAEIVKPVLPLLTGFVEFITDVVTTAKEAVVPFADFLTECLNGMLRCLEWLVYYASATLVNLDLGVIKKLSEIIEEQKKANKDIKGDFITQLLNTASPAGANAGRDAFPNLDAFRPNFPALGGAFPGGG